MIVGQIDSTFDRGDFLSREVLEEHPGSAFEEGQLGFIFKSGDYCQSDIQVGVLVEAVKEPDCCIVESVEVLRQPGGKDAIKV